MTEGGEAYPAWYALAVRSNCEQKVRIALDQRGIEQYLPVYYERVRWSDRVKRICRALFPGYVFARFALEFRIQVLSIPAVAHILGAGDDPIPVPDSDLDAVRRLVETATESGIGLESCGIPEAGRKVLVEDGPFRGQHGYILRIKDQYRLIVALDLLRRAVAVEIDSAYIRTLPETSSTGVSTANRVACAAKSACRSASR